MKALEKRYHNTIRFLNKHIQPPARILDLGVSNPFSERMQKMGYTVINTPEVDLDKKPEIVKEYDVDVVTAFEILEHLLNPYTVLSHLPVSSLIATVPLRLWFAKAYRNKADPYDEHYHEFEQWQFDKLLLKTGWNIKDRAFWNSPPESIGIRPLLRYITPRYYAIAATKQTR